MSWADYLQRLVGPTTNQILWWQMSVRGVIAFLYGVFLVRLLGRRAFGQLTPIDIVIAVVIGSNLSRALTGNAPFFPTLVATTVIMVLYWVLVHSAARSSLVSYLFKGRAVWLAHDGALDLEAMRQAGVSSRDVEESARRSGLKGLDDLQEAVLERSGKISTIKRGN